MLRDLGYRTGAFVSTIVLDSERSGLDTGFEHYDDECALSEANRPQELWRRGTDTLRAAEK